MFIFIVVFTNFRPMHPSVFFRFFMSNSGAHTEIRIELFIESTGEIVLIPFNLNRDNCEAALCCLSVVEIEPATPRGFYFRHETLKNYQASF